MSCSPARTSASVRRGGDLRAIRPLPDRPAAPELIGAAIPGGVSRHRLSATLRGLRRDRELDLPRLRPWGAPGAGVAVPRLSAPDQRLAVPPLRPTAGAFQPGGHAHPGGADTRDGPSLQIRREASAGGSTDPALPLAGRPA